MFHVSLRMVRGTAVHDAGCVSLASVNCNADTNEKMLNTLRSSSVQAYSRSRSIDKPTAGCGIAIRVYAAIRHSVSTNDLHHPTQQHFTTLRAADGSTVRQNFLHTTCATAVSRRSSGTSINRTKRAGVLYVLVVLPLPQNRMQRCAMDCAADAKDLLPAGAKEGDAVVERAMAQVRHRQP